jgi:hypothetical protein
VAHLVLVARLISPALAAAALAGESLSAEPLDIWWQPERGGAFPLSLSRDALSRDALSSDALSSDALSSGARRPADIVRLLEGPVQELSEAFARLRVSPLILRGNVASAVNGAATAMIRSAPAQQAGRRALEIAVSLYEHPALRGAATIAPDGTSFRRRSCCLIYRALPGTLCGDCVLRRR